MPERELLPCIVRTVQIQYVTAYFTRPPRHRGYRDLFVRAYRMIAISTAAASPIRAKSTTRDTRNAQTQWIIIPTAYIRVGEQPTMNAAIFQLIFRSIFAHHYIGINHKRAL